MIESATCFERQNPGTTVTVRDLFFKVKVHYCLLYSLHLTNILQFPARRRILTLTDRTIKRFVITTALAFPHVGFSVIHRDTKILSTKRVSKRSHDLTAESR